MSNTLSLHPVFDPRTLEQLSDLIDEEDASFLDELFQSYLETASEAIATLRNGEDHDVLRRAAHTLKGSSLNVGAIRVATVCKELEHELGLAQLEDLSSRVAAIEAQVSCVRESYPKTIEGLAARASA